MRAVDSSLPHPGRGWSRQLAARHRRDSGKSSASGVLFNGHRTPRVTLRRLLPSPALRGWPGYAHTGQLWGGSPGAQSGLLQEAGGPPPAKSPFPLGPPVPFPWLQLRTEAQGPGRKPPRQAGKEASGLPPLTAAQASRADSSPVMVSPSPCTGWRAGEAASGKSRHLLGTRFGCHAGRDVILDAAVARKILPAVILRGPGAEGPRRE